MVMFGRMVGILNLQLSRNSSTVTNKQKMLSLMIAVGFRTHGNHLTSSIWVPICFSVVLTNSISGPYLTFAVLISAHSLLP